MRTVRVGNVFSATVYEAESCWYDTGGWPAWVDGLHHVIEVTPPWPAEGSRVVWQSGPAGRGRVSERVLAQEPLSGQTVAVEDDSIRARQTVAFTPNGEDRVEVALSLEYELKRRTLFTGLVDALFIRRAMERSLATTLTHFGLELDDRRQASRD
jgi:uncharacterized membrane protein